MAVERSTAGYSDGIFEPDAQTDLALDFLTKNAAGAAPFFLMVSYGTPHDPWVKSNVPTQFYDMFKAKMARLNDTFPASAWYRDHWIDGNRRIIAGANGPFPTGPTS